MTRMTFPQDRTAFVYQNPGEAILTPPRTGIEVFLDVACTQRADLRTVEGEVIAASTVFTGNDGLVQEFLGPDDDRLILYGRVLATTAVYPIEACLAEPVGGLLAVVADLKAHKAPHEFVSGEGAPGPADGDVGGFYLDVGAQQLWGPKVDATTWPARPIDLGMPELAPTSFTYNVILPTQEVIITHPLGPDPTVTYINTEDEEEFCGVSYPSPSQVAVSFGSPSTGRIYLRD